MYNRFSMLQTPILSQRDARWAWKYLGFSYSTIGGYGCLVACLTMLAGETDVSKVNDLMKGTGPYGPNNGGGAFLDNLVVWGNVQNALKNLKLVERGWTYNNDKVRDWIYNKKIPVIVEVDAAPIGSPRTKHFVLYVGDAKLVDPWTGQIRPTSDFPDPSGFALYQAPTGNVWKDKDAKLKIAVDRVKSELDSDLSNSSPNYEGVYNGTISKLKRIVDTGTL